MRLAGPDVVLFIAGALVFSGALYGLYATGGLSGGATSAFGAFTLTWSSADVTKEAGTFGTGPSADFAFNVTEDAVTTITITVSCAYANAAPGVTTGIEATVTGPNGANGTGSGACGTPFDIVLDLETAPTGGAVSAANEAEAVATAQSNVGKTAKGDYSGTLTFSPSSAGPVGLPVQVQFSGSVQATLTQWKAAAAPVTR